MIMLPYLHSMKLQVTLPDHQLFFESCFHSPQTFFSNTTVLVINKVNCFVAVQGLHEKVKQSGDLLEYG